MSHIGDEKYFVVVSNNQRNRHLPQVLAVRLTTSAKPEIPSIVRLDKGDPFVGSVVCDDIAELWPDEVTRDLGALSPRTMAAIGRGLAAALDI
jgi:mRNA interferase MazF